MKNGGLLRERSSTAAKEEVSTILFTEPFDAAVRIERTPFRAGIINSFSLSFVSYVSGYSSVSFISLRMIFLVFERKGRNVRKQRG